MAMNFVRTVLSVAVVSVLAVAHASAQCVSEPNTGCAGNPPPQCSGSSAIGQNLDLNCLTNGRTNSIWLIVGGCPNFGPQPIGAPITCFGTCNIGVDLATAAALNTGPSLFRLSIPNDPRLVGLPVCIQCAPIISSRGSGPCLTLSEAVRIVVS